jgi:hypothetical protein
MNTVKNQKNTINFKKVKEQIYHPELFLMIELLFIGWIVLLMSGCSVAYDEVVPFSNKISKDQGEHRISAGSSIVILESIEYNN